MKTAVIATGYLHLTYIWSISQITYQNHAPASPITHQWGDAPQPTTQQHTDLRNETIVGHKQLLKEKTFWRKLQQKPLVSWLSMEEDCMSIPPTSPRLARMKHSTSNAPTSHFSKSIIRNANLIPCPQYACAHQETSPPIPPLPLTPCYCLPHCS
ncbi:hypothetical protein BCR42DRAFT_90765 [Absidia repens]|uniref:Uncharacterized protein n=1 Tax=Absidia repens TaxID=90262 RepID=A0A1X2IYQ8_9FUNG|nr:hypothetical protein BCR42DRAFT_90765 [Absidia repens]